MKIYHCAHCSKTIDSDKDTVYFHKQDGAVCSKCNEVKMNSAEETIRRLATLSLSICSTDLTNQMQLHMLALRLGHLSTISKQALAKLEKGEFSSEVKQPGIPSTTLV